MMKKRRIGTHLLGLVIITCLVQCKMVQEKELNPQLDSYFEQLVYNQPGDLNEGNKPGYSVIIIKKDSVIYKRDFGSANLNGHSPITEATIFDIASLSKQFTGMAIAI